MPPSQVTRRSSLHAIGVGLAGLSLDHPSVLAALQHAREAAKSPPAKLGFLKAWMAAEIEAIAAQILPSDATAGAREAGVIYFIDRALATFDRDKRGLYRDGLANLRTVRLSRYPDSKSFASLSGEHQVELLRAIEKSEFFEAMRVHTVIGFLAAPGWGGNRGRTGWAAIGFEDRHMFDSPFGYYDDPKKFPESK